MRTLNLGILAHIDAGKTSLTERLLHTAGIIDQLGRVDHGDTRTDTLALERQRGITIRSAVVSFVVDDVSINLIDTPGHPDFIAEVERVLGVLDGAVLVVSAVEGVQAQTRILMRALRRLAIPTLIFVNKIDRGGAQPGQVLRGIAEKLTPSVISMGSVDRPGTRAAEVAPYGPADAGFGAGLVDRLTDHDDTLLADYVDDETAVGHGRLRSVLVTQTGQALVHPVFAGSAATGAGVRGVLAGITELLPARRPDPDGPVSGVVFKVDRGAAGEKLAYLRLTTGTVRVRDRLQFGPHGAGKVTAIGVFDGGSVVRRDAVRAGQIGLLRGLGDIRIGDAVGTSASVATPRSFPPPTLETVVVPGRPGNRGGLHSALAQLAEQDPLINLRQDEVRNEVSVSLYGEVQKEVIGATLADDFGLDVSFRTSTTICLERPIGTGAAAEVIAVEPNPFLATVGLRIEPAPVDTGVDFRLGVELGSMPYSFIKAVDETVRDTLRQGLCGWQVTDCVVTMTHSGYWARQSHSHGSFDKSMSSTAGDFRNLTPLVLMAALRQAGTQVYEPMHRFDLEFPADVYGAVLPVLARMGAVPGPARVRGSVYTVVGEIPAASVHLLDRQLPALTRGEGVLECAFDHYRPVSGSIPTRARSDRNPLDRKEYLLRLTRRLADTSTNA